MYAGRWCRWRRGLLGGSFTFAKKGPTTKCTSISGHRAANGPLKKVSNSPVTPSRSSPPMVTSKLRGAALRSGCALGERSGLTTWNFGPSRLSLPGRSA
ncbi:hypothetical protein D3C86_2008000 [compost metagenome]